MRMNNRLIIHLVTLACLSIAPAAQANEAQSGCAAALTDERAAVLTQEVSALDQALTDVSAYTAKSSYDYFKAIKAHFARVPQLEDEYIKGRKNNAPIEAEFATTKRLVGNFIDLDKIVQQYAQVFENIDEHFVHNRLFFDIIEHSQRLEPDVGKLNCLALKKATAKNVIAWLAAYQYQEKTLADVRAILHPYQAGLSEFQRDERERQAVLEERKRAFYQFAKLWLTKLALSRGA